MKTIFTLALAAALTAGVVPAMAATAMKKPAPAHTTQTVHSAKHFYIAENANSQKCEVTASKPDGKSLKMVGKYYYKSDADATHAMQRIKSCKA